MPADAVTACVHIDAPPERVYEYFTRPEATISWMGEYALLEAEPGGRFALDVKGAPVRGRFLELDPPRRLLICWGYAGSDHLPPGASTVEVRLTADRTVTLYWTVSDGSLTAQCVSYASNVPPPDNG